MAQEASREGLGVPQTESKDDFIILTGAYIIYLNILWPAIFIPVSFLMFYVFNPERAYVEDGVTQIPTLSNTGSKRPGALIFTYGLHFDSMLLSIFFLCLYFIYRKKIKKLGGNSKSITESLLDTGEMTVNQKEYCKPSFYLRCCQSEHASEEKLHKWNFVALILGLCCVFLLSLVGTVTLVVNDVIHTILASLMFLAGTLHILVFYFRLAYFIPMSAKQINLLRIAIFIVVPFNIFLLILSAIVYSTCGNYSCKSFAINMSPIQEYITVLAIFLHIYSFFPDFQMVSLNLADFKNVKTMEENYVKEEAEFKKFEV